MTYIEMKIMHTKKSSAFTYFDKLMTDTPTPKQTQKEMAATSTIPSLKSAPPSPEFPSPTFSWMILSLQVKRNEVVCALLV